MADSNVTEHTTSINGHDVVLFSQGDAGCPANAAHTDWILVKFDQPVSYELRQTFQQNYHLEIHERLDDENVYLCKYTPENLNPVISDDRATHLNLYPNVAVPVIGLATGVTSSDAAADRRDDTNGDASNSVNGVGASRAIAPTAVPTVALREDEDKLSLVIALHPNPSQTAQQVLEDLQTHYGAEHLDHEIVPAANLVRVRLDRSRISDVAAIDSIRSIEQVQRITTHSLLADAVLGTNSLTTQFAWTGLNETVHVADTGFDKGSSTDVHPAFTGRVLAATTSANAEHAFDEAGHGTHVAGSVLGDLSQSVGNDMTNMRGTAPKANLVSLALDFDKMPPLTDLFTQRVGSLPPPTIHTNSWGLTIDENSPKQFSYDSGTAQLVDQAMSASPGLCILFSAGNDGRYVTQSGRQQQVGGYASAKNNIVVGASYSTRPLDNTGRYSIRGTVHAPQEMTTFSSRGPTLEGRIGVDVVAPGEIVLSARSRAILQTELDGYLKRFGQPKMTNLMFSAGTSMSTPAVAGCVACLRQAYRQTYNTTPSGAMLKALIIHGAVDLKGTVFTNETSAGTSKLTMTAAPNTFQGYGMVNMVNSVAPLIQPPTGTHGVQDGTAGTGTKTVHSLNLPSGLRKMVVTLAYTDIEGPTLQNIIKLKVKGREALPILPLQPTDPLNQSPPIAFTPSNTAKIVVTNPTAGAYDILLDIVTMRPSAPYAVVWSAS